MSQQRAGYAAAAVVLTGLAVLALLALSSRPTVEPVGGHLFRLRPKVLSAPAQQPTTTHSAPTAPASAPQTPSSAATAVTPRAGATASDVPLNMSSTLSSRNSQPTTFTTPGTPSPSAFFYKNISLAPPTVTDDEILPPRACCRPKYSASTKPALLSVGLVKRSGLRTASSSGGAAAPQHRPDDGIGLRFTFAAPSGGLYAANITCGDDRQYYLIVQDTCGDTYIADFFDELPLSDPAMLCRLQFSSLFSNPIFVAELDPSPGAGCTMNVPLCQAIHPLHFSRDAVLQSLPPRVVFELSLPLPAAATNAGLLAARDRGADGLCPGGVSIPGRWALRQSCEKRECRIGAAKAQATNGWYGSGRSLWWWEPDGCRLRYFKPSEAHAELARRGHKKIYFMGDSLMRNLYSEFFTVYDEQACQLCDVRYSIRRYIFQWHGTPIR